MSKNNSKKNELTQKQSKPETIQKEEHELIAVEEEITTSFEGALPHPTIFANYENVLPCTAERILRMAEKSQELQIKDQDNYHEISKRDLELSYNADRRSQVLGFTLGFVGLCGSGVLLYHWWLINSIITWLSYQDIYVWQNERERDSNR